MRNDVEVRDPGAGSIYHSADAPEEQQLLAIGDLGNLLGKLSAWRKMECRLFLLARRIYQIYFVIVISTYLIFRCYRDPFRTVPSIGL